jgi:Trp operon repressor
LHQSVKGVYFDMNEQEYNELSDFEKMIKACNTEEIADWLLPEVLNQEEREEIHNEISVERIFQ